MIDKDQKIFNNIGSDPFAVYNRVVEIADILKVEDAPLLDEQSAFLQAVADWFDPNTGDTLLQKVTLLENFKTLMLRGQVNRENIQTIVEEKHIIEYLRACELLNTFNIGYVNILNFNKEALLDTLILNDGAPLKGTWYAEFQYIAAAWRKAFTDLVLKLGAYCNFKKENDLYKNILNRELHTNTSLKYHLINNLLFQSGIHDPHVTHTFSTLSNIVHKTSSDPKEEKLRDLIRQALKDPITNNFNYDRDPLEPFDNQNERPIFRLRDNHFDIRPEIGEELSFLIDSLHPGIAYDRLYYDCHPENHFLDTSTDYFKEIILFLTSTDMEGMKCIDQLLCHNPSDKYNFHILLNNIFEYLKQNDQMNWEIKFKYSTNFRKNYNAPAHEVKMYFLFAVAEYLICHDAPLILESFITNVSKTMSFESQIILFKQIYKIKCEIKANPYTIAKIDDIIFKFLKDEKTRREYELTLLCSSKWFSNDFAAINYDLAKMALKFSNTKALKYFLDDGISPYFAVLTNRNPLRLNLSSNSESDKLLSQYGFFTSSNISILQNVVPVIHYLLIKPYVIYYFLFVRGLICNIIAPFLCIYSGQFLNGFSGIFDDFSPLPYEIMKDALYMTWFWTQVTHLYSICWAEILYINWEPKKDEYLSLSHRAVVYETAAIMFCINISYNCINFISNLLFSTSARDTEEHNVDLPTR